MENKYKVFLSHSWGTNNSGCVSPLYVKNTILKDYKDDCWECYLDSEITSNKSINIMQFMNNIKNVDLSVFFITEYFFTSIDCMYEATLAAKQKKLHNKSDIIIFIDTTCFNVCEKGNNGIITCKYKKNNVSYENKYRIDFIEWLLQYWKTHLEKYQAQNIEDTEALEKLATINEENGKWLLEFCNLFYNNIRLMDINDVVSSIITSINMYKHKDKKPDKKGSHKKSIDDKAMSLWLPNAEVALGNQSRFKTYSQVSNINEYITKPHILGVASVKGMGKTFALQIKRVKLYDKSDTISLPKITHPDADNNWATEHPAIENCERLLISNNPKECFVSIQDLWICSIAYYTLFNIFKYQEAKKILTKKPDNNYIRFDKRRHYSLSDIIDSILSQNGWHNSIKSPKKLLCDIADELAEDKKINIYIDKVDQPYIQDTHYDAPNGEFVGCNECLYTQSYNNCNNPKKSEKGYCIDKCKKDNDKCCLKCPSFNSTNEDRVFKEDLVTKEAGHVTSWHLYQLGLYSAAYWIDKYTSGRIKVYYTIRQEAFSITVDLFGESAAKIAESYKSLYYTKNEQRTIYEETIINESQQFLINPELKKNIKSCNLSSRNQMISDMFLGITYLCHPYCKSQNGNNIHEDLFDCLYRHSFDRTRDIQRYGKVLSEHIDELKPISDQNSRANCIKEIIENEAAKLAFIEQTGTDGFFDTYFQEKKKFMPKYWGNPHTFASLLKLIDHNLLHENEIRNICSKINNIEEPCKSKMCNSCDVKLHPFSLLYKMGYLGIININQNNENNTLQYFVDSKDVTYYHGDNVLGMMEKSKIPTFYVIHPALGKSIQKLRGDFLHFNGFILGKNLPVDNNVLSDMVKFYGTPLYDKYFNNSRSFSHHTGE